MTKVNINQKKDYSPSLEEVMNELSGLNTRLMIENLALKLTVDKLQAEIDSLVENEVSKD